MPVTREYMERIEISQPIIDVVTKFIDIIEGIGYVFNPLKIYKQKYGTTYTNGCIIDDIIEKYALETDLSHNAYVHLNDKYSLEIKINEKGYMVYLVHYKYEGNLRDLGTDIYKYENANFDDVDYSMIMNLLCDLQ